MIGLSDELLDEHFDKYLVFGDDIVTGDVIAGDIIVGLNNFIDNGPILRTFGFELLNVSSVLHRFTRLNVDAMLRLCFYRICDTRIVKRRASYGHRVESEIDSA